MARELALQALYSDEFKRRCGTEPLDLDGSFWLRSRDAVIQAYSLLLYSGVNENRSKIDEMIIAHSKTRDLAHISIVDLSILRLGVFSLMFDKDVDSKVVIDESVKLSLDFSNDVSFRFVNGILDAIARCDEILSC